MSRLFFFPSLCLDLPLGQITLIIILIEMKIKMLKMANMHERSKGRYLDCLFSQSDGVIQLTREGNIITPHL